MPSHRPGLSRSVVVALALTAFWTGSRAGESTQCLAGCANGACAVKSASSTSVPPKPPELSGDKFQVVSACEDWTAAAGHVLLRYRRQHQWFQPPALGTNDTLEAVLKRFPADQPCSIPTSRCLQTRMAEKVGAAAGHGVDSQAASPAGTNEPCVLGLPCGMVLPPGESWAFRLADPAAEGRWRVRITRGAPPAGAPATFEWPVAGGRVQGDGRRFSPGSVYAYDLIDAGGRTLASGEFAVASAADSNRLRTLAARRAERDGMGAGAAWLDTLAASEFDWDVDQLLRAR